MIGKLHWIVAAAVLAFTGLLYWQGLQGPFLLDDAQNISNLSVEDKSFAALWYQIFQNGSGMLGRVVSIFSFTLTGLLHGMEPWGFKFDNLIIHLINGVLIFRVIFMITSELDKKISSGKALHIAGAVAVCWLIHPLLVSTVLYAVQRMSQLSAMFTLLAMLTYLQLRVESCNCSNVRFLVLGWVLFPLLALLAIFSKETGVLIPLFIVAFEVLVFRLKRSDLQQNRRLMLWLGVFVALPLLLGVVGFFVLFDRITNYSTRNFTLEERLLTQLHVVFLYAKLVLLPRVSDMSLYHDDFPVTSSLDWQTSLLLFGYIVALVAVWLCRCKAPFVSVGIAWFLISHLLESTIIPLELVFEHRNYLASVGLLLIPIHWIVSSNVRGWLVWCLGAYVLILAIQTHSRVQEWGNEQLLLQMVVNDHPNSIRGRVVLANYLFNHGGRGEAREHLLHASKLDQKDAGTLLNVVFFGCVQGVRETSAFEASKTRLGLYPVSVYTLNSLENITRAINSGICKEIPVGDMKELVEIALSMPQNQQHPEFHGYIQRNAALLSFIEGRYAEGVIGLRLAFEESQMPAVLSELIKYQIAAKRFDDADDTLAVLEEYSRNHFNSEAYLLNKLAGDIAAARE